MSSKSAKPVEAYGWAAKDTSGLLSPFKFLRRTTGEHDVQFKVLYCGLCDWDVITTKNTYGTTKYPFVPGHEIMGIVTEIGNKVKKFKVGDKVGVGNFIGSCGKCERCNEGLEPYCPKVIYTDGTAFSDENNTVYGDVSGDGEDRIYGGYSNIMVANEYVVFRWPENLPLAAGVPILCGGIVPYSPMRHFGLDKPGLSIGVVGFGRIGKLAVKFAKAFGANVTVISTSISKKQEAIEKYGVDRFLISKEPEEMKAAESTLDGIFDCVPSVHPLHPLLNLLKFEGTFVMLGVAVEAYELPVSPLLMGRRKFVGSISGTMKETQEMLDFAAKHNIVSDIELIPMDYVNTALERIAKGNHKDAFVIDIENTLKSA
uniref:Tetrahydroalstonine synthase 2 n=2 Tax=Catharanthus roseus TaxID=4058 RepID=A0A1B1FHQ0_CATRO|nr:tetrahydroalstonine synthase 2 [Catharanthus roseus]